ncbi:MAG: ribonuclease Y [Parachlamydiaceae bacterium]|nr:ribonuclease Y [Parachlamydiaceae bacterium]
MQLDHLAELLAASLIGIGIGMVACWISHRVKVGNYQTLGKGILQKAESEVASLKRAHELTLKQAQVDQQREMESLWQGERRKIQREEERIQQREDKLETRMQAVEKKMAEIERRELTLGTHQQRLEEEKKELSQRQANLVQELEKLSGLSATEAKDLLINRMTHDVKTDAANLIRRIKKEAEEEAEREANIIITTAINRLAVACVSETTVNTVAIPNDEMKGRVIGREGRNIRALEHATGVNFVVDDTPGAIVLSGYDPIRLQVARLALTELVTDGRIYPTRIEEAVEKAQQTIKKQIKQNGEDVALRAGIMNLHPEILTLLGKLRYRFSYGQNVLDHSLEVSHLMGMMAAELGLDVALAKRIGLLHDMGKAVTHEVEGSHAIIGYDLALKYGESKEVANGIGCHHNEMEPITIEGSFCSAADAISASRPGARIEAVEEYVKRLKKLEEIACEYPGVDKAFAMQAGREVRIVVMPDVIDDDGLVTLVRNITKRIEQEVTYPGKIRVTAIREKRVMEYAM